LVFQEKGLEERSPQDHAVLRKHWQPKLNHTPIRIMSESTELTQVKSVQYCIGEWQVQRVFCCLRTRKQGRLA
jgi:hypothetical protein